MNDYDKNWCQKLLNELFKLSITTPFRLPVDPIRDNAPNYFDVVKNPMDLGTMKKKLSKNEYGTVNDFVSDIRLICNNSIEYNGEQSLFGFICNDILNMVARDLSEKSNSFEEEWYKQIAKASHEIYEHIKSAPPDISFNEGIKINFSDIDNSKAQKILKATGFKKLTELEDNWLLLNSDARRNVKKICK